MQTTMTPFGPSLPQMGWVPAPRYAMRRARIMDIMAGRPPGRLVEVGCGSGALLSELARSGFDVVGLETSPEARKIATAFAAGVPSMRVTNVAEKSWSQSFDYLFSFEVLEHIEDHVGALRSWVEWLRPGGVALISVPAHMRLWGPSDIFAGHFRRYARSGLVDLMEGAGLSRIRVEAYGFPVSNIIEPVRNAHHDRILRSKGAQDKSEATARSGIERTLEARLFPLMSNFPGCHLFAGGLAVQRWFRNSNLGTGFIGLGYKPDQAN